MAEKVQKKSNRMGKGLDALFGGQLDLDNSSPGLSSRKDLNSEVLNIKIRDIEPNPEQPRKNFDKEKLEALADSILTHGLVQPIVVKKASAGMYIIVAGERRWRASKLAGLKEIPCIITDCDEKDTAELALIENLQREDLNPIEEAEGYKHLMENFKMTQEEVSKRVGKSRSTVANALRLNNLCDKVKEYVISKDLSQGHARALLPVADEKTQIMLAEKIIKENLNVRQVESLVSGLEKKTDKKHKEALSPSLKKYYSNIENALSKKFGTGVKILHGKKKSKIEFEYTSKEELERLLYEFSLK